MTHESKSQNDFDIAFEKVTTFSGRISLVRTQGSSKKPA